MTLVFDHISLGVVEVVPRIRYSLDKVLQVKVSRELLFQANLLVTFLIHFSCRHVVVLKLGRDKVVQILQISVHFDNFIAYKTWICVWKSKLRFA